MEEETLVETRLVTDDGSTHAPSIHPSIALDCIGLHWIALRRGEGGSPGGSKGRSDTIGCYAIPYHGVRIVWGAIP